jgi:hypothetical protein
MSKPKTHAENLVAWQAMVGNLVPYLASLPHLADDAGALAEVVARAEGLDRERALCEARLRGINRERRKVAREGRDLRNRLAAGVQSAFGLESKQLVRFGIKPRPEKARRTGLTALQKAQRAADRAARKVAEVEAKTGRAKRSKPRDLPS